MNTEIQTMIWKKVFRQTLKKIPNKRYECPNCWYHGFPCLECAHTIYKFYLGMGYHQGIKIDTERKMKLLLAFTTFRENVLDNMLLRNSGI